MTDVLPFLLAAAAASADPEVLAYGDLPRLVAERSGAVRAAADVAAAEASRRGHLLRSMLPQVTVTGGYEGYRSGGLPGAVEPAGRAEAAVNLFRGGRDRREQGRRAAQARIAELDRVRVTCEELAAVRTAYWEGAGQSALAAEGDAIRARLRLVREAASRRAARGLATDTDTLAFDVAIAQLDEEIETATNEAMLLTAGLAARLGFPPDRPVRLADALPGGTGWTPAEGGENPASHPAVLGHRARADVLEHASWSLGRWWVPSLDVYSAATQYTRPDRSFPAAANRLDFTGGLRVSFTPFDWLAGSRDARHARALAGAERTLADHATRLLAADLAAARRRGELLTRRIGQTLDAAARTETLVEATLKEYDLGLRNSQDVLAAIERLAAIRRELVRHRLERERAAVRVAELAGES